ncbi:acyl-CoA dehydrogenase family protein [Xanthobacteraceae bacterium A53D]
MSGDQIIVRLRETIGEIVERAADLDHDDAVPRDDIAALDSIGILRAPLRPELGGAGLGCMPQTALQLAVTLRLIGWASLPLGRLYEGHVNALSLVQRFGSKAHIDRAAKAVMEGRLFGVWNTEPPDKGLHIEPAENGLCLTGRKTFASGAGFVSHPLVTARWGDDAPVMVLPRLNEEDIRTRSDLSGWQAHGMRASASGAFDFSGVRVSRDDLIGVPGDYHRQPWFSAGAWRFLAVQAGGISRLVDEARRHLTMAGRAEDPHQIARMAEAAASAETARLWVEQAAHRAEGTGPDAERVAYVDLARGVVERAGMDVLERVHRSVGLAAFHRNHPIERLSRDLATYLRQPAPDGALAGAGRYILASDVPVGDLWS